MYLTKLVVNKNRRKARYLLGNPQAMHAAIESCFVPDFSFGADFGLNTNSSRILWRMDQDSVQPIIYIVSAQKPSFEHIREQVGWPGRQSWQSAEYDRILTGLAVGQKFRFRVSANPVHSAMVGGKKRRVGHVSVDAKVRWLLERCDALGIKIPNDEFGEPMVTVTRSENLSFRRRSGRVTISRATFDGVLEVVDPDKLRNALTQGIGHAKSYGCGLMTLAAY